MKTILVPVDFSEACDKALDYAIEFAQKNNLHIYLLNVYDYSYLSADPLIWVPVSDEYVEEHLKKLEAIRNKIHQQYGNQLKVKYFCEPGTVIETINSFVEKYNIDLIIMGMQGGGYVSEKIIGSTATSLMRESACPVLGISRQVKYRPVTGIVLATDHQDADYKKILKPLKDLIRMYDAHLHVLYVVQPDTVLKEGVVTGIQVSDALKEIPYTMHTLSHDNVAAAIDQFIQDKLIDMAVIIPRKHSFFYSLFHEANTKKLAFHSDVPLLALHE